MKTDIKIVSEKSALNIIKNNPNVVIVHSNDGCGVCQQFIPNILDPIAKQWPNVKFKMIKEKLTFPVASHPVTYFFKNGKCIMHPAGGAPDDAVRKMMESLYGKPI